MKSPTDIVSEFLQNTAPDKIEAAAERLIAEDAIYISLNFGNPELKKILPWTGTAQGREAYTSTFNGVANWWTIEDFQIHAMFGEGEDVAVFGEFTYRSNTRQKSFRSPLAIHAKVRVERGPSRQSPAVPSSRSKRPVCGASSGAGGQGR